MNWVDPDGLKQTPIESKYTMQDPNWKDKVLTGDSQYTIGQAGCAVATGANMISSDSGSSVTPLQVNNDYVEKGELSWSKLGTAYGYTVDASHNDNTSQFTHETLEAQKNDSKHEYRTVVKVQYRNSESPHWVGVKDSKTIDGVDYIEVAASSNNDYSITEASLRGQQGWKKEGDHVYVPVNKTKGYVNFIKGKSS